MSEIKQKAEKARDKKALLGADVNLKDFARPKESWDYDSEFQKFDNKERDQLLRVGVELTDVEHAATFMQADASVVHCQVNMPGIEVLPVAEAINRYDWVADHLWRLVPVDTDKYTAQAELELDNGFFIRVQPGVQMTLPVETCLYMRTHGLAQHIHNLIVVEPGASLHVITGCTVHPVVSTGLHIGVSEFYVRAGGRLTSTMIHNWAKDVHVRPRTAVLVEEAGRFISNYILLKPVGSVQTYPTVTLQGKGAVARINSILVAHPGSELDIGGKVILDAPQTRAEIISRSVTVGGVCVSRGHLIGMVPEVKAHLECRGLILSENGVIYAVPELEGRTAGVEMSHEAAVGRIAAEEIEYLMARGMDEDQAVAAIVRGFLKVKIEGLPPGLEEEIDQTIRETGHGL
ncbi:SufB/SufD family protein [Desulfoferrobacter suflitae]|uniref:SufB/SufD family protein n=1 Tax=Desulfoferrobacter suflitae TaxID=2865782 RepID=UPI002164C0DB|nr:SufD family Fe-S cluster assembly protein [Desulfoferrobacter suflitae]MCK8603745.1 SufD family Fe-S cluster assembly protein [Desulfoferrobacter suflitae]